ncbi:hypothetical protein GBA52_022596 [Prunus armeniaca]|nr:hypothetical protein GBA52_022596 [Prunus armeniaca]
MASDLNHFLDKHMSETVGADKLISMRPVPLALNLHCLYLFLIRFLFCSVMYSRLFRGLLQLHKRPKLALFHSLWDDKDTTNYATTSATSFMPAKHSPTTPSTSHVTAGTRMYRTTKKLPTLRIRTYSFGASRT